MGYVVMALRVALAGVFLLSFLSKVRDRSAARQFIDWVRQLELVPPLLAPAVAGTMLLTEGTIVGLVAFEATSALGFILAAILMSLFSGGIGLILRRGGSIPCRCFGASTYPIGRTHLARTLVVLAAAVLGAVATIALDPASGHAAGNAIAVAVGIVIALLLRFIDEIVFLFTAPSVAPSATRPRSSP